MEPHANQHIENTCFVTNEKIKMHGVLGALDMD